MIKNNNASVFISKLTDHLRGNIATLVRVAIFCVVGIVIGIVLLFGEKSYLALLTTGNQNMLGYISGSASVFAIFWKKLFKCLFANGILFIFCLNYYTSFLGYIYLGYQSAVCTILCGTLIKYQGFSAILNTILLIVPSNLILIFILAVSFSVFVQRARTQNKYKQTFVNSFLTGNFNLVSITCIFAILILNIATSLLVPLLIKGISLIYY